MALLVCGACSTNEEPPAGDEATTTNLQVEVSGEWGSAPSVDVDGVVHDDSITVVDEGDGKPVEPQGHVLVRRTSVDPLTGEPVPGTEPASLALLTLADPDLETIANLLAGQNEGSRVVLTLKDEASAGEVVVVDILHSTGHGEEQAPPEGFPRVSVDADGRLTIDTPGAAVESTQAFALIEGSGKQVRPEDTLVLQVHQFDQSGNLLSTTVDSGPATIELADTIAGVRDGLTDFREGSRVILLVPSGEAQGRGDRVVVADILAIADSASG